MSIFKYPPYQRTIPWRCDADYEMAVVSPVGIGPKGDTGDSLHYEDLTDEDKLDLGRKLIESGLQQGEKGEQGDAGANGDSAYEIAVRLGYEGTEEEWIESLTQYPALSDPDKEEMQGWVENYFGPEVIEDMVSDEIDEQADSIADRVSEGIYGRVYPVGSIYMSVNSTDPSELFGGTWEQLEDTFLLAAGETHEAGETGGEEEHVLTSAETAHFAHTHSMSGHTHTTTITHTHGFTQPTVSGGYSASAITGGSHTHQLRRQANNKNLAKGTWGWDEGYVSGTSGITNGSATTSTTHTHNLPSHTHSVSGGKVSEFSGSKTSGGPSVANTGSIDETNGAPHNNMPPYLAVYMWKRIA